MPWFMFPSAVHRGPSFSASFPFFLRVDSLSDVRRHPQYFLRGRRRGLILRSPMFPVGAWGGEAQGSVSTKS